MGDVASGIKAFKKGMAEDDTAKPEPVKSIDQKTADGCAEDRRAARGKRPLLNERSGGARRSAALAI